jgi:hypothetical protein
MVICRRSGMKLLWQILRCYLGNYFEGTRNFSQRTGIWTQGLLNTQRQCCQSCMTFSSRMYRLMFSVVFVLCDLFTLLSLLPGLCQSPVMLVDTSETVLFCNREDHNFRIIFLDQGGRRV